jgi:pyridoxal phosphate enzyme (YggS family)
VNDLEQEIAQRLTLVRDRMARAAKRVGRDPDSVRLVAVSKTFGVEHVAAAAAAGQRDFGENRVQEALQKIAGSADKSIRWHLIGHLQSNKVRKAVGPFACIHSVDRLELLDRIETVAGESGRTVKVLVQVDLAGEATKHGAMPDAIRTIFARAVRCQSARVEGLMLLPPFLGDPEAVRPWFVRLRRLRDDLAASGIPEAMLGELSMGMSHDFEVAIEEGATIVRIGTAVFGSRA